MPSSSASSGAGTSNTTAQHFRAFFESWLARQEHFGEELDAAAQLQPSPPNDHQIRDLVNRVRAHYLEYYEEKSRMTSRDIFLVFSPVWFTSLERTFLWIAGFKPGLACRLAVDAVDDLTQDQARRINRLGILTKREEKTLNEEMAKIQESLADPPLMHFIRSLYRGRPPVDGEIDSNAEAMLDALRLPMENLLTDADRLRTRTADGVMAILTPTQSVKFLAAAAQLHLKIRMLGLQRDADRAAQDPDTNGW